jgi:polygalacturonase
VKLRNLTIRANNLSPKAASSDGIDIDSSRNVLVENCDISVEDDCISMKSGRDVDGLLMNRPTENVIIRNCRFGAGHGAVVFGSEISGWIRNVHAYNCTVDGQGGNGSEYKYFNPVVRFKTAPGRGGGVENVVVENFQVNNTVRLVSFEIPFGERSDWKERFAENKIPLEKAYSKIRNIAIRNMSGCCDALGNIEGYEQITVENVLVENVYVKVAKEGGFDVRHATDVAVRNINAKMQR